MITIALSEVKSITICSPSLPHLKKGALRDFVAIMEDLGIYDESSHNRTDQVYSFPNGSYIEFFGVEDEGRVRGPGRDILYCNEAILIPYLTYKQLALRTRETIFIDFNAADEFSWVYEVADDPANKLIISTYKNNLSNLSKEQIAEIESLQHADPNLWRVYGLGLRGYSSESIYTHWKLCNELPGKGEVIYGQDFGYNVPSALIKIELYEGAIYCQQTLYQSKLTTNDLVDEYKILGIHRSDTVYCDNAEPKTIEEICRAGYNAVPAEKDVLEGIRTVKGKRFFIHKDSADIIKEVKSYKWKVDKDGKIATPEQPVKFNDHAMDAIRYAVFTYHSMPQINWMAQ